MKKLISILMTVILFSGMITAVRAEDDTVNKTYPVMEISTLDRYKQHYVNGESMSIIIHILDEKLYDDYEKIIVYTDCNKDVIACHYYDFGENRHTVTETGYRTELDCERMKNGSISTSFTHTVKSTDNPDVSIKAYGVTADGNEEELATTLNLPANKVYEKDEIPHFVTNLQPPVFGDYKHVSLNTYGNIFVFEHQTPEQIIRMLDSSAEECEIRYIKNNSSDSSYVTSGDVFALEFEGRYCDFLNVYVIGDLNSDGNVTSADARLALRKSAKFIDKEISNEQYADVNHDGELNAADARLILRVASQTDHFSFPSLTLWLNQQYKIGPVLSASDGGYLWRCTVSEESAIEVTETIEPSVDNTGKEPDEIIIGAHAYQTFTIKPLEQGTFKVHFELIRPWETEPIQEFSFTVLVDDIMQ